MEAPGVPRGAAPVRGPPPAAQHSPELEPRPPSSLRFSQPWQCPQRQTSEAPGGLEALSTLDLPLRGPPETKVTCRTAMHPAPTDRGNTRLPLWRKTQEADTCSSPQTSGFLISETRFLPVSERREPRLQRNAPHSRSPLSPCPPPTETRCTPGQPRSGRPRTSS